MHVLCRESRPVPFNARGGELMQAAAEVADSCDVDENFVLLPFQRQSLPQVPPAPPRPPTPAATSPKPARPGGGAALRKPLAQHDPNLVALARELSALEARNAALERQLALHGKLVAGFSALYNECR